MDTVKRIREAVKENEGYCPCKIFKTKENKCMCQDFVNSKELGPCYCGLYIKTEE